ncbi:hypothetical protein LTR53_013060 [Teratosphaeriaceae sp. CCFEE 6253]|nr:hypothetical protein LTR53_013060 [Teratosphaeriaceae sp. CCFEE 6253]
MTDQIYTKFVGGASACAQSEPDPEGFRGRVPCDRPTQVGEVVMSHLGWCPYCAQQTAFWAAKKLRLDALARTLYASIAHKQQALRITGASFDDDTDHPVEDQKTPRQAGDDALGPASLDFRSHQHAMAYLAARQKAESITAETVDSAPWNVCHMPSTGVADRKARLPRLSA